MASTAVPETLVGPSSRMSRSVHSAAKGGVATRITVVAGSPNTWAG